MYHAAASFTDGLLAELLSELEKQKLHEATLTVLVSDHGFALGEHGAWAKWSNWEVATRIPFAVRAPWLGASIGTRITSVVELVDLYPTMAELAGVPVPGGSGGSNALPAYAGLGGRSLASIVEQPRNGTEGAAFSQIARCWPAGMPRNASSYATMAQCDQVPPSGYAFFGYSIRVAAARYNLWVPTRWDAATARHMPQWDAAVGAELYDHSGGDESNYADGWTQRSENANLVDSRPAEAAALRHRLVMHVDATLRAAAGL